MSSSPTSLPKDWRQHPDAWLVSQWAALLGVKVTGNTLRQACGTAPSMDHISRAMEGCGVATLPVRLRPEQLPEAPLPMLLHLQQGFALLTAVGATHAQLLLPGAGQVQLGLAELQAQWKGAALLASPTRHAGEAGHAESLRRERIRKAGRLAWPLVLGAVLLACVGMGIWKQAELWMAWVPMLLLKAAGAALTTVLVQGQFAGSKALARLCPSGEKVNCDSVLRSPLAKLGGWLPLSELGAFYFLGGLLTLLVGLSAGDSLGALQWMAWLNLLTLPLTVVSVVHQGVVLRQWCLLCVLVVLTLWLEAVCGLLLVPGWSHSLPMEALGMLALGFGVPLLAWLALRPSVAKATQVAVLEETAAGFRRNAKVVEVLAAQGRPVEDAAQESELEWGEPGAQHVATLILSPFCPHCAEAYLQLSNALELWPQAFRLRVRFSVPDEESHRAHQVAAAVMQVALAQGNEAAAARLRQWYAASERQRARHAVLVGSWLQGLPPLPHASVLVRRHSRWATQIGIAGTPAAVWNGRLLQAPLLPQDLPTLLRSQANT